ncbi:Cytochrome c family protein [hydrothermal vent metagenome]|uniref:Cytochrome c family protein n=1 Tax=hydrothermal vent metagenome TaxID=652676 RepID=A0A1W1CIP4_9ZZZZ
MKTTLLLLSLLSSMLIFATENHATQLTPKEEGIKYIKMLGGTLKKNLKAQMKADKTGLSAMAFCANKADEISKEVNTKLPKNTSVRRTTLQTRNPNNKADALDMAVMEQMIIDMNASKNNIEKPIMLETINAYRVYKPLLTKPICLKCHGNVQEISPEIEKMITKNYPKDMARNFKVGDLRGVIVSEIQK